MNETGTPQPGPMGENGTATAQPLKGLASAPLFGVWRPVAEYDIQVTDYHPRVLVWDGNRHWTGRFWEEDSKFHCDECMKIAATHWMILPAPPNDKDQATRGA